MAAAGPHWSWSTSTSILPPCVLAGGVQMFTAFLHGPPGPPWDALDDFRLSAASCGHRIGMRADQTVTAPARPSLSIPVPVDASPADAPRASRLVSRPQSLPGRGRRLSWWQQLSLPFSELKYRGWRPSLQRPRQATTGLATGTSCGGCMCALCLCIQLSVMSVHL